MMGRLDLRRLLQQWEQRASGTGGSCQPVSQSLIHAGKSEDRTMGTVARCSLLYGVQMKALRTFLGLVCSANSWT